MKNAVAGLLVLLVCVAIACDVWELLLLAIIVLVMLPPSWDPAVRLKEAMVRKQR